MLKRTIENHVLSLMNEYFSVTIFGPRQCGKTTLAKNLFPNFSYANLEDMNVRALAKNDPEEFFVKFPEPVIIDEIQRVPELLSAIQVRIDKNQKKGQYVITGSQQISLKSSISQSLAGRTAIVQMLPLSISELYSANIKLDRDTQLVSGFMPFLYSEPGHSPFEYYKNYVNTYLERDIVQIAAVHDLIRFEKFLRLLAGRTGQLVNNAALAAEVGISSPTIGSWISILEASHIIYTLKPWYKNRTSQVVKTPKIYFCDTGLVSYLLGIETPSQMLRDPLLGNVFENLVVTEALKTRLNLGLEPNLFFYRNSNGLEIDLILKEEGKLKLFEIKSGKALNEEFCKSMKNFSAKYKEDIFSDSNDGVVIYSGDCYESYKNFGFYNFSQISELFNTKKQAFRLDF